MQPGATRPGVASGPTKQMQCSTADHLSGDALQYLAEGFSAFELKRQHPDLGQVGLSSQIFSVAVTCRMWLPCLSRGGLRIRSDGWSRAVEQLENDFRAHHGSGLWKEKNVIAVLVKALTNKFPAVPEAAIRCFIRTFIRMRYLNRQNVNTRRFVTKRLRKSLSRPQGATLHIA